MSDARDDAEILEEDDTTILQWAAALDVVDYFTLLGLPRPASDDDVPAAAHLRDAFHAFAASFHPDRHRGARDEVLDATALVFRRGAEAYRVLRDPLLGRRYVRLLREAGRLRLSRAEMDEIMRGDVHGAERYVDVVKSAAAVPFARRADELRLAGHLREARLQLVLAVSREPDNVRLAECLRALEADIARGK